MRRLVKRGEGVIERVGGLVLWRSEVFGEEEVLGERKRRRS